MSDAPEKEESIDLKEVDEVQLEDAFKNSESSNEDLPFISDYLEVLELIGSGGMGAVYKARDKQLDQFVAVKVLQKRLAEDKAALKRFEQEAEAASKLSHPNLVSIYRHGQTEANEPYIVMDYYEGESLSNILKEEGCLKPARALHLVKQISEALEHAHKIGVVHRDIKPTNIIVSKTGDGEELARIVDFGIAKVMPTANRETHNLTETGEVFGSPHYMSPEQCLGFMLDNRSDIYSLGCLMYELLTGEPPFGGSNPIQVVVKHINEEIQSFSGSVLNDKAGRSLESVTMRCLEKDQSNRYQSAKELIKDLNLIEEGKQPPKYKKKVKEKREFTKRQVIASVVGLVAAVFYGIVSAVVFQQYEFLAVLTYAVVNLLVLGGIYVSFGTFKDQVVNLIEKKINRSGWWQLLMSSLFGIVCLTVIPFSAVSYWFIRFFPTYRPPDWFAYVVGTAITINLVFAFGVFVSGIGWAFFGGKRRVGLFRIGAQFLGIATSIIVLVTAVFPRQVGDICLWTAQLSRSIPVVGLVTAYAAHALKRKSKFALQLAVEAALFNKDFDRAISLISEGLNTNTGDYDLLALKVDAYLAKGDELNAKVAAEDYFRRTGKTYLRTYFRGRLAELRGDFNSAAQIYKRAIELYPQSDDMKIDYVRMLCATNQYARAREELEKMQVASTNGRVLFLAALMEDQFGDPVRARSHFKRAIRVLQDWNPILFEVSAHQRVQRRHLAELMRAYAYYKLGDKAKAEEAASKAGLLGIDDLNRNYPLKNTGLKVNW